MQKVLVLLSLILFGSAAQAADLYSPPPAAEAYQPVIGTGPYNWAGLYTGAFAGMAFPSWSIDFDRNNNHGSADVGYDGFAGGAYAGFNWMIGPRTVLGIEGDIGWSNASQDNHLFDNDTSNSEVSMFGSVRGRLGYSFGRMLVYGTAGFAFANIDQSIQKGQNAGEQVVAEGDTSYGYVVGGGIEYAFDPHWIGRLEYLYSDYGNDSYVNRDGNRVEFSNDMSLIRVGLAYKF
ncbi:MAG: outer membrane protein [Hyphomicrobiaceae bacterium]